MAFRIGHGFDIHALVPGRPLVLGGVEIPSERGLAGHSDADAALHALTDALLGAIGAGDIGRHYPDSDRRHVFATEFIATDGALLSPATMVNDGDAGPSVPSDRTIGAT